MHLANDIRYAFRQIHRSPGFCGIALLIGIPLACVAGRFLSGQLFGVGSFDLPVVAIAVPLLSLSAALAALLPARRAPSIEPMQALRSE